MNIIINEEYSKLAPAYNDRDYQGLLLSIQVDGQKVPIIVNQHYTVIDGHTRLRACKHLKREPRIEIMQFPSKTKEIEFIRDSNLRRHLNEFQKIRFAYNIGEALRKEAKARQLSGLKKGNKVPSVSNDTNGEIGRTRDKIAATYGIAPATYSRGIKIIQEAPQSVIETLNAGKSSVSKEYKRIQNQEKRKALMDEAPKIQIPDGCQLLQGDFMEVGKDIPNDSIDLILTDPPYGGEYLPLYEKLGIFANRVLKPGGSLVTFPSYRQLESLNLIENSGLKCCWQFCVKLNGHHSLITGFGNQIDVGWKSLVWFVKGNNGKTNTPGHIFDFIESEPPDKALHPWEQSPIEAEHMIKGLTVENQIVLDPFMGSGTNGIAAYKLKRGFIGIDIDPIAFATAQARLSSMTTTVSIKK